MAQEIHHHTDSDSSMTLLVAIVLIVAVVALVWGGYYYMNQDHMGQDRDKHIDIRMEMPAPPAAESPKN